MAKRKFTTISDSGGFRADGFERSACDIDYPVKLIDRLTDGLPMVAPKRRPVIRVTTTGPLEDMPWCGMAIVVSDRFRSFLEAEATDHAQFFEVKVVGPKKSLPQQPYFVVNWLHLVDCIDMDRTEYEIDDSDAPPRYTFARIVLATGRIPPSIQICRLKFAGTTVVIDDRLDANMRKAGITGPQYYRRF